MLDEVLSINTSTASADKVVSDEVAIKHKMRAMAGCQLFY
jgi:hypothetical protein